MAAAECSDRRRRFAVACGVLSRCVRADAAAATGKVLAVATPHPHHHHHHRRHHPAAEQQQAASSSSSSTMLLMPGADVGESEEADATPAPSQLTIMYGGRVLVFDGVRADTAAALVRAAAARRDVAGGMMTDDVPVARKASLRRFMEKRRDRRFDAGAPYGGVASPSAAASKKGQEEGDAGCWLGLGITRGQHAR